MVNVDATLRNCILSSHSSNNVWRSFHGPSSTAKSPLLFAPNERLVHSSMRCRYYPIQALQSPEHRWVFDSSI